ncbi:MAG: lipopolysaccharide biosynthesis protein [Hellea sp.]|nr:lipopolysaccharide biosynthesis protein [Hellea sp.]
MIGRSMLAYIPVNLATLIVSFGGIVILTRLLGSAEYGRYAIAMITMMTLHMGFFTWIEAAMARYQARAERKGDVNTHVKTLYAFALRTAVPALALFWLVVYAVPSIPKEMKWLLYAALASTSLQLFFNLGMEAHKAAHRIRRYSASFATHQLMSFSIGLLLLLLLREKGWLSPEVGMFFGIFIATIAVLIIDLPFMLKKMKGGSVEPARAKNYFKYGMPISISLILTYALSSADMYLIAGILGNSEAGEYSASYNLANRSLDVLFIWIGMAVTPIAVTALEKEGLERSTKVLKDYGAALLWIAMPAATGIALIAEPAGFILGEEVRQGAVKIMPLIAFAGVMNGMISYYAQRAFMLSGKTDVFVWAMVPPVLLNIGLNLWLIPQYELMGAVWATVISYAVALTIALVVGRRYFPIPIPVKAFVQISFACLVMAAIVYGTPIPDSAPNYVEILIKAVVGVAVYGTICFSTDTAGCREIIKNIYRKFRRADTTPRANAPLEVAK